MKILVTGGGTGGHIYPALAFVNYVKTQEPNAEFMYVGAKRGLEDKIVPDTGMPFHTLEIQGFKRKISMPVNLFLQFIAADAFFLQALQVQHLSEILKSPLQSDLSAAKEPLHRRSHRSKY